MNNPLNVTTRPDKRILGLKKDGRWQRKINGTVMTFGSRLTAPGAPKAEGGTYTLEESYLLAVRDYEAKLRAIEGKAVAGRLVLEDGQKANLRMLANLYLEHLLARTETPPGATTHLTKRSYLEAKASITAFVSEVSGRGDRIWDTLTPTDFTNVKIAWDRKVKGIYQIARHVQWTRCWWKWLDDMDHIPRAPKYGVDFRRPGKKAFRLNITTTAESEGDKRWDPEEIHAVLPELSWEMKAPFLLGLNCAFYAEDVADISLKYLNLKEGYHWMPRGKTMIPRRCPLWDITIKAIEDYIQHRWVGVEPTTLWKKVQAKLPGYVLTNDTPLFVTKYRKQFVNYCATHNEAGELTRLTSSNNGYKELQKVLRRLADEKRIKLRKGLSFGSLRHTFITVAKEGEKPDDTGINLIAGHAAPGVLELYQRSHTPPAIRRQCEERLRPIVDAVRRRLGL